MMRGIIMAQCSLAFTGWLLTGVAMLAAAAPALAESPAPEIVSPLVATPIAPPNPVLGADARRHLVYESVLMDIGGSAIALNKIEVLDASGDVILATLQGEPLAKFFVSPAPAREPHCRSAARASCSWMLAWLRTQWSRTP